MPAITNGNPSKNLTLCLKSGHGDGVGKVKTADIFMSFNTQQ